LLKNLEKKPLSLDTPQLSLLEFQEVPSQPQGDSSITVVIKDLKQYPVVSKTPIEAMNAIAKWQEALKDQQSNF
jgi:hypothetical protein